MRHIRSKILLLLVGGLVFTSVVSTISIHSITSSSLEKHTVERIELELEHIAGYALESILVEDHVALQELVRHTVDGRSDIIYMFVMSTENSVLASSFAGGVPLELLSANELRTGSVMQQRTLDTEDGRIIDVAHGIMDGQAGVVHLGVQEAAVTEVAREAVSVLLVVQATSLAFAALASFGLSLLLVRPINKLLDVVRRVGQGDLSARSGVTSQDEIGTLARAFDLMIATLARSRTDLEHLAKERQAVVSSFPNALFVTDLRGVIQSANPAACAMVGIDERELFGRPLSSLFVTGSGDRPVANLDQNLRTEGPTISYAMSLRRVSAQSVPIAFNAAPMLVGDGELRGFVIEVRNLRRLRQAIETLQQQRDILEESTLDWSIESAAEGQQDTMVPTHLVRSDRLVSLGQLAASVAHELNNPLFSITASAKVLERDLKRADLASDTAARTKKAAATILAEAMRCSKILKGFLGYARVHAPETEQVSVGALVEDVGAMIAGNARQQQVNPVFVIEEHSLVRADKEQLRQVVLNLMINALHAMQAGGTLTVRVRDDVGARQVKLSVEDTGEGIPKDILSRVFEPFYTTKDPGEGTGLGLAIAQSIVAKHQGTIEIRSLPGQGTTVDIGLPLQHDQGTQNA